SPGSPRADGPGEPGAGEPGAGEPGAGEPGAGEPGAGEPGAGEPGVGAGLFVGGPWLPEVQADSATASSDTSAHEARRRAVRRGPAVPRLDAMPVRDRIVRSFMRRLPFSIAVNRVSLVECQSPRSAAV